MCIYETNMPSVGGSHSPGTYLVVGRDGAGEVKGAVTFRMAGLFGSRERRRFAPRPRAPSTFWSSPGARFALLPLLGAVTARSEEHTSELQSLMRISYAVLCLKKKQL